MASTVRKFTLALVQMMTNANKQDNLRHAAELVEEAVRHGASLVALPECFNSPYGTQYFRKYSEKIPDGESVLALSAMAKQNNTYLIGGSIPEVDGTKLYNTCTVFGPDGKLIAKHRKIISDDPEPISMRTCSKSSVAKKRNCKRKRLHLDSTDLPQALAYKCDEDIKNVISKMSRDRVNDLLLRMVKLIPEAAADLLQGTTDARIPSNSQNDISLECPPWCICGICQPMPTEVENVCCGMANNCITRGPQFPMYCIDEGALRIALRMLYEFYVEEIEIVNNNNLRHAAYRNFVLWQFGRLGRGDRVVIPACVVQAIRNAYPDPNNNYTGFRLAFLPP